VVAVATGRLDGLLFLGGVVAGIFVFGEAYPLIANFMVAGDMGAITLPEYFNLPYGLVVLAVVLMALAGFLGAGWVERRMAKES